MVRCDKMAPGDVHPRGVEGVVGHPLTPGNETVVSLKALIRCKTLNEHASVFITLVHKT